MEDEKYDAVKQAVLSHIRDVFEEMEEGMAMSHQEKYTLLEDLFENATDSAELRVAFEQWYADHVEELSFEHDVDELWEQATMQVEE